MKQLVMTDFRTFSFEEVPIPVANKKEVVVRVIYAGICGSDQHIFSGEHPTAKPPIILGHEFCGEVYSIGEDTRDDIKIGDLVSAHAVIECGICEGCIAGFGNQCRDIKILGTMEEGFFTQYVKVPDRQIVKFKSHVKEEEAALVEPLAVAVHDVHRSCLSAGEDVFIVGAGTIGIMIALVARLSGASNIVISELDPDRVCIAESFGFNVVNARDKNFDQLCLSFVDGDGYDKVFEVTASQAGFDSATRLVKVGGTVVQVGMPSINFDIDINKYIYGEINLLGVRNHPLKHFKKAAKIINDGLLKKDLERFVSKIYPLTEAIEAFDVAEKDKKNLKILICFDEKRFRKE